MIPPSNHFPNLVNPFWGYWVAGAYSSYRWAKTGYILDWLPVHHRFIMTFSLVKCVICKMHKLIYVLFLLSWVFVLMKISCLCRKSLSSRSVVDLFSGLLLPSSGWVEPSRLCHPGVWRWMGERVWMWPQDLHLGVLQTFWSISN